MTDNRAVWVRLVEKMQEALTDASRNKEAKEQLQPHLTLVSISARQLREHLVETVKILIESTDFAKDLEQDLATIEAKNLKELDLAIDHWDDMAQMTTIAARLDDVFFVYDPRSWVYLLKLVDVDIFEEALGKIPPDKLMVLLGAMQRVVNKRKGTQNGSDS